MVTPTLGWGTSTWGGEQIDTIKPPVRTLDILPLDAFRTEFMGRQWGIPSEFLVYDGMPYYAEDMLAYTLLHGVLIRPSGEEALRRIAALWKVYDEFPFGDAAMYPYWDEGSPIECSPKGVHATAYERAGEGLLVIVSNLGDTDSTATVAIDAGKLPWARQASATDALSGDEVGIASGRLEVEVPSWRYRVLRVRPE